MRRRVVEYTITAEAIKLQRDDSLKKYHDEVDKYKDRVRKLEEKIASLDADVAAAYAAREKIVSDKEAEIKSREADLMATIKVAESSLQSDYDSLATAHERNKEEEARVKRLIYENTQLVNEARNIEARVSKESERIDRVSADMVIRESLLKQRQQTMDAKESEIDKKISDFAAQVNDIDSQRRKLDQSTEVLKLNRDTLVTQKKEVEDLIRKSTAIKEEAKDELERLRLQEEKLRAITAANDDASKSIKLQTERNMQKEAELDVREKALNNAQKDLDKRERYIKIKERGN